MRYFISFFVLLLTVPSIALSGSEEDKIRIRVNEHLAAWNAGNVPKISDHYLSEATIFPLNGQLLKGFKKEDLEASFKVGLKVTIQYRHLNIQVNNESAVITGYVVGVIRGPKNETKSNTWRMTEVRSKVNGRWLISHIHLSQLLPDF